MFYLYVFCLFLRNSKSFLSTVSFWRECPAPRLAPLSLFFFSSFFKEGGGIDRPGVSFEHSPVQK